MNGLDLFSGIGGISLGLSEWVRPVAYCENDRYAQSVLLSRIGVGELTNAPIWDDVTSLRGSMLPSIDIIYGGFPCQDISVAGRGAGLGGERSGLFFEIIRLAKETRAPFVFLENVPAIRTRGLREVVRAFTDIGYDCRWTCVSAAEVGAPHLRKRWFLLAYSIGSRSWHESRRRSGQGWESAPVTKHDGSQESLADSGGARLERNIRSASRDAKPSEHFGKEWWKVEPNVGRVVDGLPHRVDRIKCLGNAVVPAQVREAFKRLSGLKLLQ